MTDTSASPFTGVIFEILVGSEKTRFVAHASVLEKSDKLKAVTRGKWKDSSERVIVLEDWEPETVSRFLEWLYTGDYEAPHPSEASPSEAETLERRVTEKPIPSDKDWKDVILKLEPPKRLGSANGSSQVLKPLEEMKFDKANPKLTPSHAEAFTLWTATYRKSAAYKKSPSDSLNFEGTLLAHAKLYSLADYMLLPRLQAQVFQRLKAVLLFMHTCYLLPKDFSLPPKGKQPVILNIVTLIRYVYANTVRLVSEEEPLRELISTFVALNYDKFRDDGGVVRKFMGQGGDFQEDLYDKMQMKVLDIETELKLMKMELKLTKTKLAKETASEPKQLAWTTSLAPLPTL